MRINPFTTFIFIIALALLMPTSAPAQIRQAKDPVVEEYLKAYKDEVKAREKAERKARRDDPYRTLRPYRTLDEVNAAMDEAVTNYPDLASVSEYGKSVDGRPLRMLKIGAGEGERASILYSANIHGGEMAGNMICLELIRYFTQGYARDRDVAYLLERVDVYVIPVLNPDGMARTVAQQGKYGALFTLTRKNTNKVDLNRNYPYPPDALDRLKDSAGSNQKWMVNYRGPEPLSEPESKAMIALYDQYRFDVHCNWHTTGGLVMSPPATLPEPLPDDGLHDEMRKDYQAAMFDPYDEHTELEFYPTIGSLDDYLYHRYGTLCVTMEVGKDPMKRLLFDSFHNGAYSPLFWTANVHYVEREIANNAPAAVRLAWWALKVHEDPELRKWKPSDQFWVGEPPRP